MFKKTVQFEDFDETTKSKTLYFNLTFDDVMENADIEEELNDINAELFADGTAVRELSLVEKARIVKLVKRLMQMAYGVQKKNDEGDLAFDKSPVVWENFVQTAAYDAFFLGLFTDESGEELQEFMNGVFPANIRQQVAEARAKEAGQDTLPIAPEEPKDMTREELLEAMKKRNQE